MTTTLLPQTVQEEITRLSEKSQNTVTHDDLEKLVLLAIDNDFSKSKSEKSLKLAEIKEAIYKRFDVKDTEELKKSEQFKMATDGMGKLNLGKKETWEMLYRKWIDILPDEQNQEGYGCINGINIFDYFRPWQVFNLDSKTATKDDIKKSFYQLSKIYHPDNQKTGDRRIFERLDKMYKSIIAGVS
jgi:hypothetical protein